MKMLGQRLLLPLTGLVTFWLVTRLTAEEPPVGGKPSAVDEPLVFERDVRPIFKSMCFHCHGEEPKVQGGIDLRLVRLIARGGDSGPGLVHGDADKSLLWARIESDEMPEGAKKLSSDQKNTIRRWIEAGAKTRRPEPENVEEARFSQEELDYWAFKQPTKPSPPQVRARVANPIDAFIAERLEFNGLDFSPEAGRATLIRRLKVDLLGLPPTRAEVEDFLADQSDDAYERLVDRFLQQPQYGERWARHWLDVAGYSESDGNQGKDRERTDAWRYRDYVIQAFNKDKPYNAFLVEQLAGDQQIEGPLDAENDRHVELLTATGFLRMAPDVTGSDNTLSDRNQAVADVIKVVSSSILGLSVGCAQCHDHRYDPISIEDYYRFRAIFDPIFPLNAWKQPDQRLVDLTPAADRGIIQDIESIAVCMEADIKHRQRIVGQQIFDLKLAAAPEELRPQLKQAIETPEAKRTEEQKKLLFDNPMIKTVEAIVGQLVEFDRIFEMRNYKQFEKEKKQIAEVRETKPLQRRIMCVSDSASAPESAVFFRGDPEQRKQSVEPSELFVLVRNRQREEFVPSEEASRAGARRRLAYAEQLTDGKHPLVARVAVNRIWQHHFGTGLVATPNDFGVFGQRPTHPELLDYLAVDFVENGWQIKRLHKRMVMSRTYRQSSSRTGTLQSIDPENRLYGRMNVRRMDAEVIRDSMLLSAGVLNTTMGGPSVPVAEDAEGRAKIGKLQTREGLFAGLAGTGTDEFRRSIYLQSKRQLPLSILETFDMPVMNPNCDARKTSTVALQSLLFLNDETIVQLAEKMGEHVWAMHNNSEERLHEIFLRLFAERASAEELSYCHDFLISQRDQFAKDQNPAWLKQLEKSPYAADQRALASLCQTLIASNRFLYID
jgi:hypothetical protein